MKKIISLLLVLVLIAGMLPVAAVASENDGYCTTIEAAADQLRHGMLERRNEIAVRYRAAAFDGKYIGEIMNAALVHTGVPNEGDYLYYNYDGYKSAMSGYAENGFYYLTITYTVGYKTTASQEEQVDEAVDALLAQLNPTGSDYEKLCQVYDWISKNIVYDYNNLSDSSYVLKHTPYAAMINRTAVCEGYSGLLYRLMLELDIDCRVVTGVAINNEGNTKHHSWNIVKLGDQYYNVDVTWDAAWLQSVNRYGFFLKSQNTFGKDHFRNTQFETKAFHAAYPMSVSDYKKDSAAESAPVLYAPDVAVTTNSAGKAAVGWNAVEGAVRYEVYRATSKTGPYSRKTSTGKVYYTDNSVAVGKTYYYKVRAIDANGKYADSDIIAWSSGVSKPRATVCNHATTGKPVLTWAAVTGAVKYEVYCAISKNGAYSRKASTAQTTYTHTAAVGGKTYYYFVRAIASDNRYADSEVVSCVCRLAKPTVTLTNNASTGKPVLSWGAVAGAEKYEVYRATGKNGTYSRMLGTTKTTYTNSSAKFGTTYYYKVRALAADGSYAESDVVSGACALTVPTVTASNKASTGKPTITWETVDGAVKYEIYRATKKNGTYTRKVISTGTAYTNTDAVAGKTYYYKVRAIDAKGNYTDSSVVSCVCDLAQTTVTLSNKASTGKIIISWEAVTGATKYQVYRATAKNGTYSRISTTTNTQITNTTPEAGKTYYYKVRAVCDVEDAKAAFSAVKSCICDLPQPSVSAALSAKKPKVSWKTVDGAVSYQVYRATSKTGTYTLVATSTGSYYKDTAAVSGKTYYYKVIAVCSTAAGNSAYSGVVSVKSK